MSRISGQLPDARSWTWRIHGNAVLNSGLVDFGRFWSMERGLVDRVWRMFHPSFIRRFFFFAYSSRRTAHPF